MKRYLCWDHSLIEKNDGVEIRQHEPVKKNLAFLADDEWEGVHNGYAAVVKVGDTYRMYYRASFSARRFESDTQTKDTIALCVVESRDGGITYKKPVIGKHLYNGSTFNNIVFTRDVWDNFFVFYDENPACPADEKFKGLCETHVYDGDKKYVCTRLLYYASADGYDFREMYYLDVNGVFDSFNVCFWDKELSAYRLYYRAYHSPEGVDKMSWAEGIDCAHNDIRDVRFATSKDFKVWTAHGRIRFCEGQKDTPLYTNQIVPYGRGTDFFIGFPVRYSERGEEGRNFAHMPLSDRRRAVIEHYGREGTAITDTIIMTSSDGFTFNRRDESFIRPGIEHRNNWWYGACYTAYGLYETEAEEYGAPNELSFFVSENYRIKSTNFRRYTVRLDGFFSYYAKSAGGVITTVPVEVSGDALFVNFSSGGAGGMTISLCDENEQPIEGYESYLMFGDSVDRPVEFDEPLSKLAGRRVRLKIRLSDTHIYSFCFK